MDKYIVKAKEIEQMEGLEKQHFLNPNALRNDKSLGDLVGLTGLGFHIIEVKPAAQSTEMHFHYNEDECVYILDGCATARIGDEEFEVSKGDFIGYRAGGMAHTLTNTGTEMLKCIVVGQRLDNDIVDYTDQKKRMFRGKNVPWNITNFDNLVQPSASEK